MAAFLGDIAFLFETVLVAAGLLTLHRAAGDPRPVLLKVAGIVLVVAGVGGAICTSYYYFKYHFAGDLDHPYPVSAAAMSMMMGKGGGMGMSTMTGDATHSGGPGVEAGEGAAGPAAPGISEEEHKAHHPDTAADSPE